MKKKTTIEKKFEAYEFPFERSDDKILALGEGDRRAYFFQATKLLENPVWKQEIEELIRTFYQELALKALTKEEIHAYRLTLIAIKRLEERITELAQNYQPLGEAINL